MLLVVLALSVLSFVLLSSQSLLLFVCGVVACAGGVFVFFVPVVSIFVVCLDCCSRRRYLCYCSCCRCVNRCCCLFVLFVLAVFVLFVLLCQYLLMCVIVGVVCVIVCVAVASFIVVVGLD